MIGRSKYLAVFTLVLIVLACSFIAKDSVSAEITLDDESSTLTVNQDTVSRADVAQYLTVERIVFTSSVRHIGNGAFSGFSSLTTLSIPSSVTTIGDEAFRDCTALTRVYIANGDVGENAFHGCTSLVTLSVGSTALVSDNAFEGCTALSSVTYLSNYPSQFLCANGVGVNGVNLTIEGTGNLDLSGRNVTTLTIGGSVDSLDSMTLAGVESVRALTIDDGVSISQTSMNEFSSLQNLTISSSTIPDYALQNCDELTSLNVGSSAKVSSLSFSGLDKIRNITYASTSTFTTSPFAATGFASDVSGCSVNVVGTTIVDNLFRNTVKISSVTIGPSVTRIGSSAFDGASGITFIDYNTSRIQSFTASPFAGIESTGLEVRTSVTTIPAHFLEGIVAKTFTANNVSTIGAYAFAGSTASFELSDMLSSNGVVIGEHAFENCTGVTSFTIDGVRSIGDRAFAGCTGLASIVFQRAPTTVDGSPFSGAGGPNSKLSVCANVPNGLFEGYVGAVTFEGSITSIGSRSFFGCNVGSMSGLTSLESIGSLAFGDASVSEIYISPTVKTISYDAFDGATGVSSIIIDRSDLMVVMNTIEHVSVFDGIVSTGAELKLSESITTIPSNTFNGAGCIASVDLANIVAIGQQAFQDTGLKSVSFPSTLLEIGERAFAGTNSLRTITFLNSETAIGTNAFLVDIEHFDTNINCLRHSTAAEYPWGNDRRDEHMSYTHIAGEYSGMMEVIFSIFSPVLGYTVTNAIIDFFMDDVTLNTIESIDLGSYELNIGLLVVIFLILLLFLFVFIYRDYSEGVRIIEIILSLAFVMFITITAIRRLIEYPDWYWFISIFIGLGAIAPIVGSVRQLRSPRLPHEGETLIRLYSLDLQTVKDAAFAPLNYLRHPRWYLLFTVLPLGWIHSLIYAATFLLLHIPAYVFSYILAKMFERRMDLNDKHVQGSVCPYCGSYNEKIQYRCNGEKDGVPCGTLHMDLSPGKYGVHKAICGTCHTKIPCGYRNRRWDGPVQGVCSHCGVDININEAEPFSISVVGSPGSGKTTLIGGAMTFMHESAQELGGASIKEYAINVEMLMDQFSASNIPPTVLRPDSPYVMFFTKKDEDILRGVYLYDVNGTAFTSNGEDALMQNQYTFADGVIITINPYDIRDFAISRGKDIEASNDVNSFMDRFLLGFETMHDAAIDDIIKVPVAVVVTHSEDAGIVPTYADTIDLLESSDRVRAFLIENDLFNFVNSLEFRFEKVMYLSADIDEARSGSSSYAPVGWIIGVNNENMKRIFY